MRAAVPLDLLERAHEMSRRLRAVERRVAVRAIGPHEGWHQVGQAGEPAFANGFANAGNGTAPVRFFKDPDAFVYLDGYVTNAANVNTGAPIFTLPTYYRPQYTVTLRIYCPAFETSTGDDGERSLTIAPNGAVSAPKTGFSVSSLLFRSAS